MTLARTDSNTQKRSLEKEVGAICTSYMMRLFEARENMLILIEKAREDTN